MLGSCVEGAYQHRADDSKKIQDLTEGTEKRKKTEYGLQSV